MADCKHFSTIITAEILQKKKLEIPKKIVMKIGDQLSNVTLRGPLGHMWPVDLVNDGNKIWFHHGWPEFVNFYSIEEKHYLFFKYTRNSSFEVTIFNPDACQKEYGDNHQDFEINGDKHKQKAVEQEENTREDTTDSSDDSDDEEYYEEAFKDLLEGMGVLYSRPYKKLAAEAKRQSVNLARSLNQEHPTFIGLLQTRCIIKSSMYIPIRFARKHLSSDVKVIKLQVSDGKEWPVRLSWSEDWKMDLKDGWKDFMKGNNLKKGDMCLFELIRSEYNFFKVYFIRK